MLDVTRRFQLALSDLGRRTGLMAGAGLIGLVGAGFLLAAFWSWLAHGLGWGSVPASLTVAGLCLAGAAGLILAARRAHHRMPTAGDVQAEVGARAKQAAESAVGAVRTRAEQAKSAAEQRLHGLWNRGRYRADRAAERLDTGVARGAARVAEAVAASTGRRGADGPGGRGSDGPGRADPLAGALHGARDMAEQFARSRAAPGVALVSAFAIGLALANALGGTDEEGDDEGDDLS